MRRPDPVAVILSEMSLALARDSYSRRTPTLGTCLDNPQRSTAEFLLLMRISLLAILLLVVCRAALAQDPRSHAKASLRGFPLCNFVSFVVMPWAFYKLTNHPCFRRLDNPPSQYAKCDLW